VISMLYFYTENRVNLDKKGRCMVQNLKIKLLNYLASFMMSVALTGFMIMCVSGDYQPVVPEHLQDQE